MIIEIALSKNTNIYSGRYQTIWPTIRYLLKKKMIQCSIFREYENNLLQYRLINQGEYKKIMIKDEKLIELFGTIDEEEFY
jgi:L-rhamnose mutarotase